MVKATKYCHVTPIPKFLCWFKINERIEYKLLSLTYKAPELLPSLNLLNISAQPDHCSTRRGTHSSSVVTLSRPPTSSLKITNRSFRYASPHLWNRLPVSFRQPCINHSVDDVTLSNSSPPAYHSHAPVHHTLTTSFQAQNSLFPQIFSTIVCIHLDCLFGLTLFNDFSFLVIFLSFYFGSCGRLSWLTW